MAAFIVYLLKSVLLLALLVSFFMLFMSRETFHRTNRYLMLLLVAVSLALPLVNVGVDTPLQGVFSALERSISGSEVVREPENGLQQKDPDVDFEMPVSHSYMPMLGGDAAEHVMPAEVVVPAWQVKEKPSLWVWLPVAIYFAGVLLLLVRQLVVYYKVIRLIASSRAVEATQYGCTGIRLRIHGGKEKPFSWFRWVVVSEDDLNDGGREILTHETAHARAGHSWDIVLADVVIMLQWFNPLAWIMKGCIKDIHEFEADEAVIDSGVNAKQYQLLIIKKAVGARLYSIANSFNHSLTKKRITMMCKEKSKKWRCAKALYIVPVAAIAALSFSTVDTVNATEYENLSKGNELVANDANEVTEKLLTDDIDNGVVQDEKERQPEFPGGQAAMMKYFAANIKYPAEAKAAGKEGKAFVQFVVKADGSITNAEILKTSGDASLDAEAVRVVSAMPRWNPGTQGGKPVNVKFVLPVVFKIEAEHGPVIELKGSGVAVPDKANASIVVDGFVYEGELGEIDPKDIESMTVVQRESLTPEDIEKYKAEDKDGVIFISLKKEDDAFEVKFTEQMTRTSDYGEILLVCEQLPEFPGGMRELMQWLMANIKYPKAARDVGAQGKIYVEFVVKADGTIAAVKAVNSDYRSNNPKISDAMDFEAHLLRCQATLNMQEDELRGIEEDIAKWERESKILEEDGVAEVILERRREELEKARGYLESTKEHIAYARKEVESAQQRLADAKNELSEVVVTAYTNSNGEPLTGDELLELEKAALVALCDEAERVVKTMPKWNPGMQHGKAVNVLFTLPITFRLQ